jgi:hypothetical protein
MFQIWQKQTWIYIEAQKRQYYSLLNLVKGKNNKELGRKPNRKVFNISACPCMSAINWNEVKMVISNQRQRRYWI